MDPLKKQKREEQLKSLHQVAQGPIGRTLDLTLLLGDLVDQLDQTTILIRGQAYRMVPIDSRGKILPVRKTILQGTGGGLYYVNQKGKRIYLKEYQRRQCRAATDQVAGYDGRFCMGKQFVRVPPPELLTPTEAQKQEEALEKRIKESKTV
jgi:hypothetical protein